MSPSVWLTSRFAIDLARPRVMAIVNVTPDSFSEGGGADPSPTQAIARCEQLLKEGADILDIGGESSRPGALPVSAEVELARVRPVLAAAVGLGCPVSIDTTKVEVMRAALELGVDIVNDIAALRTPGALALVAAHPRCGVCLMHMRGTPSSMQAEAAYDDVAAQVAAFLGERIEAATAAGIGRERIVVDPGIGFSKTPAQNLELLARQDVLVALGVPLLVGWSRKSTLARLAGLAAKAPAGRSPAEQARLEAASVVAAVVAVQRGARIVRVHDVAATVAGLAVWQAAGGADNRADLSSGERRHPMSRTYFGTDGIRGTVGAAPITPDFMLRLGHAVGQVLRKTERRPTVLIGKDTRISGYMIESALEAGFASAGVDVVLTGPLPTPGVAYLTRALRLDLGVVISASHNPFADNGIKFFSARGEKLPDAWEREVETAIAGEQRWVGSAELGRARRLDDASGRYVEFCKSTYSNDLTLRGLAIVVDAAHGAAYHVAPDVFHELGAEVTSIGCRPDGFNINAGFGATAPQALVDAVIAGGADYGIALDGDGDRLQVVDGAGRLYNGDELLYVLAAARLDHGRPVPGVVGTLMTNLGVEQALRGRGVDVVRTAVGDRYVLEELLRRGWQLGGEGSGHLLALDRHTTGDGIVSALMVLEAVVRSGRPLADLLAGVDLFAQTLINVRLKPGDDWTANRALADRRAEIDRELGTSGRVLIRPSGTEPVVRVMVEARDAAQSKRCAEQLAATLA